MSNHIFKIRSRKYYIGEQIRTYVNDNLKIIMFGIYMCVYVQVLPPQKWSQVCLLPSTLFAVTATSS